MDASERDRLNTSEKQLEHSLAALLRISDQLNSTFDLDSLLDALLEQILELTSAESGCAGLRTVEGMSCERFLQAPGLVPFRYDDSRSASGWSGWLLVHGTHYLTNDALNDAAIMPEIRERFGVTSGMSIPILDSKKDVIAFFEVYNKSSGAQFTPNDVKNCLAVAQIASLAIQHALTYQKLTSLASFSQSLTIASDLEEVLDVVGHHFETTFQRGTVILLPADEELRLRFRTPEFVVTPEELNVAKLRVEGNRRKRSRESP